MKPDCLGHEQIKIRLPTDVKAWIRMQADMQERSVNWLINKILMEKKAEQDVAANAAQ